MFLTDKAQPQLRCMGAFRNGIYVRALPDYGAKGAKGELGCDGASAA